PLYSYHIHRTRPNLHAFPTRRSSDLLCWEWWSHDGGSSPHFRRYEPGGGVEDYTDRDWFTGAREAGRPVVTGPFADSASSGERADRKSTRLNSSHVNSSYAVVCLKKT